MRLRFILLIVALVCMLAVNLFEAFATERRPRVAVLDFGETETGRRAADHLHTALTTDMRISVIDRAQSRAAAQGIGYAGSLNMTLIEARDLGAAIGCDFFIIGQAQTPRRFHSSDSARYEASAAIFIVSARTGKLVLWDRPSLAAPTPVQAENDLRSALSSSERTARYVTAIRRKQEDEQIERERELTRETVSIEDAPEEGSEAARGFRAPEPYRRLRPPYPETAAQAEAEATVDVQVEIGTDGEVGKVEIVRWAGFGLDEAVISTVRQLHFRPAMRDGVPVPVRVLLRYNFRHREKKL